MLRDDLQNALREAMKNKNVLDTNAIRMIIAGLKEKDVEARGKGKEKAEDAELFSMMQTMIKQRNESIKLYLDGHRPELADKEKAEIAVIKRFFPKQLSESEITIAIATLIKQTGADSIKDMGKVMGALHAQYAGQMDFGIASNIIKKLLS